MATKTKVRCSAEVWDSNHWRAFNCSRTGSLEHNGSFYCKQHHPDTVQARNTAWAKKYNARSRMRDLNNEALRHRGTFEAVLRQIAAGHNDARGLAEETINRLEALQADAAAFEAESKGLLK